MGVVLIVAFLALDDYISLVNAALMGLDASNTWAQTYANSYVLDTFTMVIESLYLFIVIYKLIINHFFKSTESFGNFIQTLAGQNIPRLRVHACENCSHCRRRYDYQFL